MFALEVHDSVGSTNDVVRAFLVADDSPLADGFPSLERPGVVALAEEQTLYGAYAAAPGTAPAGPISSLWAGAFMGRREIVRPQLGHRRYARRGDCEGLW